MNQLEGQLYWPTIHGRPFVPRSEPCFGRLPKEYRGGIRNPTPAETMSKSSSVDVLQVRRLGRIVLVAFPPSS